MHLVSDLQGQLSLQNKLLQSIKDELAGLKRAFALAETSREDRFNAALKKLRGEFDMDRLDVMASNILSMADTLPGQPQARSHSRAFRNTRRQDRRR